MNLFFGLLWLAGAIGVFAHEYVTGEMRLTIRGVNVSAGWLFLGLAGWNLARWYSGRVNRIEQEALRIAHEARLRQARHHERPLEYDPTFDFTAKPAKQSEDETPPAKG